MGLLALLMIFQCEFGHLKKFFSFVIKKKIEVFYRNIKFNSKIFELQFNLKKQQSFSKNLTSGIFKKIILIKILINHGV